MFKELELGPRQRATVAAAITLGSVLVLLVVFSLSVWGLARFVGAFQNVLLPPVVALILTMLLRPYYSFLVKVCRGSRVGGLVVFFLSALIPLGVSIWFVSTIAADQMLRLFDDLPSMLNATLEAGRSLSPQVTALLEKYGLMAEVDKLLENPVDMVAKVFQDLWGRMSQPIAQMFQSVVGLFAWAGLPLYLAFFLMAKPFEPRQIGEFLPFLKKDTREDVIYLFEQFVGILLTFFRGQIIIALIQGVLFAVGFTLVGFPYSIVIGFTLGLLNIIPYLGSIVGLSVVLPLAYFGENGGVTSLLLVLLVFAVVQVIEGYVLTPKIMGNRTGLHPALIIFAVFFWGAALGGILGMILAIPLTAFAVVFWRLLKKKYITEVV
ncbi:AI-2E family transporter [Nitrincola iocasae]|uniref:AI-2E family transporter n=1 Tax=Nitrincola iocasae TaxID=2614693 RepID=A0A5J6LH14_9GAMM|nr:AI-2E family transporter [Nitrincola iocasae]QEW07546.1 AI-2E family transporter [Nitrincola iocasae]